MFVSHKQCNDNFIIPTLPQHLSFEVHLAVLPGSHQDAHYLVWNPHISVKQLTEGYPDATIRVRVRHGPDDKAHVFNLSMDVRLSPFGSLCRLAPLLGPAITFLSLPQTQGHGVLVIEFITKGVEFLAGAVLWCPALPAALEAPHGAVLSWEGVNFIGILCFLLGPVIIQIQQNVWNQQFSTIVINLVFQTYNRTHINKPHLTIKMLWGQKPNTQILVKWISNGTWFFLHIKTVMNYLPWFLDTGHLIYQCGWRIRMSLY